MVKTQSSTTQQSGTQDSNNNQA